MVLIAIYLVYVLVVLSCAGMVARIGLASCFNFRAEPPNAPRVSWVEILVLGWILITTCISGLSIFTPITPAVHIVVSLAFVALGAWPLLREIRFPGRTFWQTHWLLAGLGFLGLVSGISAATFEARHYDTGLYHIQVVRWINEFGVAPGLANLHGRLGFNSSADSFASYLDHFWFDGGSFHIAGLIPCALLWLIALQGFSMLRRGDRSVSAWLRCLGLFIIAVDHKVKIPALSTDWPANVLIFYALIKTVDVLEESRSGSKSRERISTSIGVDPRAVMVTLVCVFAITVKLSTIPVLALIPLVWSPYWRTPFRTLLTVAACSSLLLIPFLARNLVLTGHLLYPIPALDLLDLDWEVPESDVRQMSELIKSWAISPTEDWHRVKEMSFGQKLQTWYKFRFDELLPILHWPAIGLACWIGWLFMGRKEPRGSLLHPLALGAVMAAGIAFCFANAPEPRFAVGWLMLFGILPMAYLLSASALSRTWSNTRITVLSHSFLLICALWLARESGVKRCLVDVARFRWEPLFSLASLPVPEMETRRTEYGEEIQVPASVDRAFDAPLPNTPWYAFNPWLEMRGPGLKDGFRAAKPLSASNRAFEKRPPSPTATSD